MILICAGMSRSASTLQYQLVKSLVERKDLGRGIGFHKPQSIYPDNTITVVKSEKPDDWMLNAIENGDAKAISIYRDPRDVAVSLHHFFHARHLHDPDAYRDWTQDAIIAEWLPRIMHWYETWEPLLTYTTPYERWYPVDFNRMLEQIADTLLIHLSHHEAQSIFNEYSLVNNLNRQRELDGWIDDKRSMLTRQHISPHFGTIGIYRYKLTPDQIKSIETQYAQWMQSHGYERYLVS